MCTIIVNMYIFMNTLKKRSPDNLRTRRLDNSLYALDHKNGLQNHAEAL